MLKFYYNHKMFNKLVIKMLSNKILNNVKFNMVKKSSKICKSVYT